MNGKEEVPRKMSSCSNGVNAVVDVQPCLRSSFTGGWNWMGFEGVVSDSNKQGCMHELDPY